MDRVWEEVQDSLRQKIGSQGYEIWIRPIRVSDVNPDRVRLVVPNRYYRDWVQNNYGATLCEELVGALGRTVTVEFDIESLPVAAPSAARRNGNGAATAPGAQDAIALPDESPAEEALPGAAAPSEAAPAVRPNGIPSDKTFDNFVVGACNQFAHACACAVSDSPGEAGYNPLFIYAGTGLGKTHLVHAIANAFHDGHPDAEVVYTTGENFTNALIESLRYGRMEEFRAVYRERTALLLMDDIQFVAGKDRTQEELFYTFEALKKRGVQIVFTADVLPREISGFEPRLRTRCESGMLADMQPPDLETLAAILHRKADEHGLVVPSDLAQYVSSRVRGSIRELEGVLNRLSAFCRLYRAEPTLDFARQHLGDILVEDIHKPTADEIIHTVASFYNLKVTDLKGTRRLKQVVQPRHLAMWLVRRHCEHSFPEIGRIFGRDHATVQHACKKIGSQLQRDADLRNALDALTRNLGV